MKNRSQHPGSSTHVVIAAFVVLVFGLYVDRKLGQEGALRGQRTQQWERNDQKANLIQTSLFSQTETTKVDFFSTPFHHISLLAWHSAADQISALCHISFFILWVPARKVFSFSVSVWGETPWRLFLRYHNRPGTDTQTDQTNALS